MRKCWLLKHRLDDKDTPPTHTHTNNAPKPPRPRTLVLRPFCCPMNMKLTPSMDPIPHTIAGSSSPARSPWSSTNLSVMLRMMSRQVGRLGWRATWSRCVGVRRE